MRTALLSCVAVSLLAACSSSKNDPAPTGTSNPGGSSSVGGGSVGGSSATGGAAVGTGGATVGTGGNGAGPVGTGGGPVGTGGSGAGAAAGVSGSAGTAGSGGATCAPDCAKAGNTCCNGVCVNTDNDIHNCGTCGTTCDQSPAFCAMGTCGKPPCMTTQDCGVGNACCGSACCQTGQLCCDIPGPVSQGVKCVAPTDAGTCPVGCKQCKCNSPDTPIATPFGNRPIASLHEGDLVYSLDHGRVVAVPITRTHSIEAPNHVVVRVTLESGMVLEISAPHPTVDGRTFGELRAGDALDGVRIVEARQVAFRFARTYDILPASDSAAYFAGGVLIGSTLGAPVTRPANESRMASSQAW